MQGRELNSSAVVRRVLTAGAVWAVARALEAPRIARVEGKLNRSVSRAANRAGKSLKRRAATARRNKSMVIAGVAALAIAAGLLGRATSR